MTKEPVDMDDAMARGREVYLLLVKLADSTGIIERSETYRHAAAILEARGFAPKRKRRKGK